MKRAIPILTAFLLCLAFAVCGAFVGRSASAADDAKLELKLHFTEGQRLTLTTAVAQETTRTWNNQERTSKETTSTTWALKVLGVDDDGTATVEVTLGAIAMKSDGGRMSYEYDSANPPDEMPRAAAPYAAVVGKTFTMKLTSGGKVTGFEGVDALLKAAQDAIPDEGRGRGRWGRDRMAATFSEDALKQTMEGVFGFLPGEAVAVGGSWTRTVDADHGVPVLAEEKYTLTKLEEGTATIELEAKLKPQEKDDEAEGPRVTYDVTGTLKGTVAVDEATGCLFKTVIAQELKGDTIMSGFRGDDTERTTPITSKATITVEAKETQPDNETEGTPDSE